MNNEVSWGYQDILVFLFLSLISILGCQLLMAALAKAFHLGAKDPVILLPTQLLLYACIFAVLFALIKLQYGRSFWHSLAWRNSQVGSGAAFLIGLALAVAAQLLGVLLHTPDVDSPMKRLLSNRMTIIEVGIVAVTIGPICEELVFRGFIQPVMVRSAGRAAGILITALAFGALHLAQNSFVWQLGLLIAAAGLGFGWMREITGSTKASSWMHAGFNSTIFLTLLKPNL